MPREAERTSCAGSPLVRNPVRRFASCRSIASTGEASVSATRRLEERVNPWVGSTMRVMHVRRWLLELVLVALVATGCGEGSREPLGGSVAEATLPSDPTALPDYDFEAYTALLADLRGTPVVVNVWASWCGPCRLEAPELTEVATEYDDVRFLGLDVLDARPDARAFIP